MLTYEQLLDQNWGRVLSEGSRFFEARSAVQDALRKIVRRLAGLGVPYAVAGGMALVKHGYHRFTEDVDLLVTREGLEVIHRRLAGLGYVPPFTGSMDLCDAEHGASIKFLIAGDYPGDGKRKPLAFPDPTEARVELEGIFYLDLPSLVELKLASGMTGGVARLKDFADVVALIQTLRLPAEFGESLDSYVRARFFELWNGLQDAPHAP